MKYIITYKYFNKSKKYKYKEILIFECKYIM